MKESPWLHRFATLVAVCTLLLIFVGGLVTSTGSGLAVPDWPLSYGQFFPEMVGGVAYEHGHRMAAASATGTSTVASQPATECHSKSPPRPSASATDRTHCR